MPEIARRRAATAKLLVKAYSVAEARESFHTGADVVFYNIFAPDFPEKEEWQESALLGAYLPRIMNDEELSRALALLRRKNPGAILTGNLGFLPRRAEFRVPVYLDYSLNPFNDLDLLFFQKRHVTPVLSPELSLNEAAQLHNKDAVIFCHGDVVLVNSQIELKYNELVSEKGLTFPVRKEGSYWQILNSLPFGLFNDIRKFRALGFSQFLIDRQNDGTHFTALYRRLLKQEIADRRMRKGYTSGHLYRPVG